MEERLQTVDMSTEFVYYEKSKVMAVYVTLNDPSASTGARFSHEPVFYFAISDIAMARKTFNRHMRNIENSLQYCGIYSRCDRVETVFNNERKDDGL